MKITVLFLLLLFFVAPCAGQQVCTLELKDAPVLFGLRLGMSEEQVGEIFKKELKFKPKKKSERTFFENFIKKPAPAILHGVRALYLRFAEHKLYQIEIFYENREEWQTLADFIGSILAAQNFQTASWTNVKGRNTAKCANFTVVADKILNPRIELTDDPTLSKLLEARQKQPSK